MKGGINKGWIFLVLALFFVVLYLFELSGYFSGPSTETFGSGAPYAIATNGTDFWVTDTDDYFVYHLDANWNNQTDGFSTSAMGSLVVPLGITTNGSDFWILDSYNDFVYHVDKNGNNQTDGFSTSAIGSEWPLAMTMNGSDFWISDSTDDWIYHVSKTGVNKTDGFRIIYGGATSATGITTNGTSSSPNDFWLTAPSFLPIIYHVDKNGNNLYETISSLDFGSYMPVGMTYNGTDFWIVDSKDTIHHLRREVPRVTINSPIVTNYSTNTITFNVSASAFINNSINCSYTLNNGITNYSLTEQQNVSGISLLSLGMSLPYSIATIGTDFWILDSLDYFVYHLDANGNNQSDGFSISAIGANAAYGMTTNGSDFWIVDYTDDFVYHVDKNGNNQTDGFKTYQSLSLFSQGITTNASSGAPTDFWITDVDDDRVYHVNKTGGYVSNFSTASFGSGDPRQISTNGSDFWIFDSEDSLVYHVNNSGYNLDIFSTPTRYTSGITVNETDYWYVTSTASPGLYHIHFYDDFIGVNPSVSYGAYTARFYCTSLGRLNNSGQVYFFVNLSTDVPAEEDEGGGAIPTVTTTERVSSASPSQPAEIIINHPKIDVIKIIIAVLEPVSNISLTLTKIGLPSEAELQVGLPVGDSYQTFKVETTGLEESQIANVTVNFKINKTWLSETGAAIEDARLYRKTTDSEIWSPLETTLVREDSSYYYMTSLSPGFSTFAVFFGKYECAPGVRRCYNKELQLCLGNATWLVTERCRFGCDAEGNCLAIPIQPTILYGILIVVVGGAIVVTSYLILVRVLKKKKR